MTARRYNDKQTQELVETALTDGYCVLRDHIPQQKLLVWRDAFLPLLESHIAREGHLRNRGSSRYYVTLPFRTPFADPTIFEDEDLLAVVQGLVGQHPVMCQLATDTPLLGSDYQDTHRDVPPLFPEWQRETPPFQLAVNFPLVDVTESNGPIEIARGTHLLDKDDAMRRLENGEVALEPVYMNLGDIMVRDVRGLHRGTPNRTDVPRPMVVIGYSRRWLLRPEVSIRVARPVLETLSPRAKHLLRFNPIIDEIEHEAPPERYQEFAY